MFDFSEVDSRFFVFLIVDSIQKKIRVSEHESHAYLSYNTTLQCYTSSNNVG